MSVALMSQHLGVSPRVPPPEMDGVMVFGFCIAFVTVVFLIYRGEIKTRLPMPAILLGASAAYGFLQGAWPLGFLLCGLAGREVWCWWRGSDPIGCLPEIKMVSIRWKTRVPESRVSRMFGA